MKSWLLINIGALVFIFISNLSSPAKILQTRNLQNHDVKTKQNFS